MKFRMIVLLLAFVVVVTGCTNEEKEDSKVTLENVIQAIRAEGPELISEGQRDDGALENVKPYMFSIANTKENAKPEAIYVYIFDSEKAVKEAKSKVNGKYGVTALTAIEYFEQKNVLVVYFATGGRTEKFGDKIQSAIQKL